MWSQWLIVCGLHSREYLSIFWQQFLTNNACKNEFMDHNCKLKNILETTRYESNRSHNKWMSKWTKYFKIYAFNVCTIEPKTRVHHAMKNGMKHKTHGINNNNRNYCRCNKNNNWDWLMCAKTLKHMGLNCEHGTLNTEHPTEIRAHI